MLAWRLGLGLIIQNSRHGTWGKKASLQSVRVEEGEEEEADEAEEESEEAEEMTAASLYPVLRVDIDACSGPLELVLRLWHSISCWFVSSDERSG